MLLRTVGVSIDETTLGYRRVSDKYFIAVEQITIAISFRHRPHAGDVGPGIGLGNREAADLLAGNQRRNKLLSLFLRAEPQDRNRGPDLHVDCHAHSAVDPRDLFSD